MYKIYTKILCWPHRPMPKILLMMNAVRYSISETDKRKLIMRINLTTVLLIATMMQVSASTFAQKLTYNHKNATIGQIFKEIKKQTGYNVFWFSKEFDDSKKVNANFNNTPLEVVLDKTLEGLQLAYTIEDKVIVLKKKPSSFLDKVIDYFKVINIRGRITDKQGIPLVGASVIVKGGGKATNTDKDGDFVINGIDENATLQISYIGYEMQEIKVFPGLINVTLELSSSKLDEVQIQAYGTTSKRMSTGNITSVKAIDIAKQPVSNVLLALQGKVPGLSIVQTTGMPGAAPTVKIRGTNSIGAGLVPLYILDGVPVPDTQNAVNGSILGVNGMSALEGVNTADVESIDVLKDADATAIYGSRGANGVVLITTKKGRAGQAQVNFNAYTGFGKVQHFAKFFDVHEYNAMRREALRNDKITPTPANSPDLFSYDTVNVHNWQKELIGGTAVTNDANVSISGGSGGTTLYANAGYHKQGTVFPGDANSIRKSVRMNANHISRNRKLTLGLIFGYNVSTLNLLSQDLSTFITMAPSYPLYTATGAPNYSGISGYPLAYLLQPYHSESSVYNGHVSLGYEFIRGLKLKVDAGFNNSINNQNQQNPLISLDPTTNTSGTLNMAEYTSNTWIAEPQLTYEKKIGKHSFNFLVGTSFQKTTGNIFSGQGRDFANEAQLGNLSSAGTITINTSTGNEYAYASLFSRLSYNYNEKYLANISFRRDGSSNFGPKKRFGNFGAVGLGWIFTKENAIAAALPFLSYGKLRGSYGVNGNDQVGNYKYISTYSLSSNGYQGSSLNSSELANPEFQWEENRKLEAALELGILKDRIIASASFFRNRTDNQLVNYALSTQTGFSGYTANFPALLQNKGWEFEVNSRNINLSDFSWRTTVNFAFSKNKLLSFPGIERTSYFSSLTVGESITLQRGYVFDGLTNTGVPRYKDLNGDGSISATDDRIIVGTKDPFTGGMSNEFRYKRFDLSFFIDYVQVNGYNPAINASRSGNLGANRTVQVSDRWQKPGDEFNTNTPKFTTSAATYVARNFLQTDVNWTQSDVVRLRNISLTYNLPYQFIKKLSMQNAKLFFQGQNLWTSGNKDTILDPETGYSTLPPLRTLTFGMNVTF